MSRKKLAGLPALRFQVDALHAQNGSHTFRCAGDNQLISRLQTQAVERFEDRFAASQHLDNAHSGAWTEPGIEQGFAHNRRIVVHDGFNGVFGDAFLSAEVLSESLARRKKLRRGPDRVERSDDGQGQSHRPDFEHAQRLLPRVGEEPATENVRTRADQCAATAEHCRVGEGNQEN